MKLSLFNFCTEADEVAGRSIRELRSVVAAHFTEEQFELTAAVGYEGVRAREQLGFLGKISKE